MKFNKAQENLLRQINTGAYVKTRPNPNVFEVHKAGYYSWFVRRGTIKALIDATLVKFDDKLRAYVKA